MQLIIILAILLFGGQNNAQKLISEVAPMLETFGGQEVKEALKSAEEITKVISAVRAFTGTAEAEKPEVNRPEREQFPLAPVANIANGEICDALNRILAV